MGYGNLTRVLKDLDALAPRFQTVVVCGNNKKAKKRIEKTVWKKPLLTLGFTRNVPLLMDAADCIISKPGGLTTSEALTKRLPMIICNPIPGHEDRNVEFLTEAGTAIAVDKRLSVADAVELFFSDEKLRKKMLSRIEVIRKPNATADLCAEIFALGAQAQGRSEA
jgi:processive 1,2-diacylglycerol beta-glucosyltransferase